MTVTTTAPTALPGQATDPASSGVDVPVTGEQILIEEDLLVEDVSIDGMCGVY